MLNEFNRAKIHSASFQIHLRTPSMFSRNRCFHQLFSGKPGECKELRCKESLHHRSNCLRGTQCFPEQIDNKLEGRIR